MKEQREVFTRVGTLAEAMAFFAEFRLGRYLKQSKASASCTGIFNYRLSKPSLGSEGTVYRDTQHRCGCHGRGRGFESRRPRHFRSST